MFTILVILSICPALAGTLGPELWDASAGGDLNRVQKILQDPSISSEEINYVDEEHHATPIYMATESGSQEIVQALVAAGADVNIPTLTGSNALHYAAHEGYQLVLTELLKSPTVNLNQTTRVIITPLVCAANHGHLDALKLLVAAGADLRPSGNIALMRATRFGYHSVVRYLLYEGGIDGTIIPVLPNRTYLSYAAEHGHVAVLDEFLKQPHMNVNEYDRNNGYTPLMYAAKNGHAAVVARLMYRGADIKMLEWTGKNALKLAAEYGHIDVIRVLLGVTAASER